MTLQDEYDSELKCLVDEQKFVDKFLTGTGCCVICFNNNPLVLEEHHIAGRRNSGLTLTLCANHHAILTRMQGSWDERWVESDNPPIIRISFLLRGISDVMKLISDYMLEIEDDRH